MQNLKLKGEKMMNHIDVINSKEYDFLRTNEHLGKNIILLGLGGSHGYGMNTPTSDLDIRGIALNTKSEILTKKNFEQIENKDTDTVIYSFNKIISLICNMNPNTCELLGLKQEHYLYLHPIGEEILSNKRLFLSKKAVHSFGGYANSQLRRLDNKAMRLVEQAEQEQHILNSIRNAEFMFPEKFFTYTSDAIKLYLDDAISEDFDKEIFMDINLKHYPLRDYKAMWSEMNNIVKEYAKVGRRNQNAIAHDKLGKHMAHLVRLYYMCFDILEKEEIITYREKEHDLLMDLRNGKYLNENRQPIPEFNEMVNELEKRLEYAKQHTSLPEKPDYNAIDEFVMSVNERVVKGIA